MCNNTIEYLFPSNIINRHFSLFPDELENDNFVFFHGTSITNAESIRKNGFKSAKALTGKGLTSVTYTRKSINAFHHVCTPKPDQDMIVLAVRFTTEDLKRVVDEQEEIKVCIPEIQPMEIGYCIIPKTYPHI
jgi:hypothetical protein